MNKPKVIISILNWIRYEDTIECLKFLSRLIDPCPDIIVIDNGSDNGSPDKIRSVFPAIQIIALKKNDGFAAGHNYILQADLCKDADLLWILNPDVKVRPDSLSCLVGAYIRHGPAIYGSITLKSENPDIINFGGGAEIKKSPFESAFSYNDYENCRLDECMNELAERKVQSVEGSSMLIPVEVIRKHGFMDPRFFLYGEETDYCLRMWKKGIPSVIVPSSVVIHRGAASFAGANSKSITEIYYRTRNWRIIARKYFGMKRRQMLRERGGFIAFLKFFAKYLFGHKKYRVENRALFYENLAVIHAVLNIGGKQIKPEKHLLPNQPDRLISK